MIVRIFDRHPLGCAVLLCLAAAAAVAAMLVAAMDPPDEPAIVRASSAARPTADLALLDVGTTTTTSTSTTTTTTAPPPTTTTSEVVAVAQSAPSGNVWYRLADCESGEWDRNRNPIPGSARWSVHDSVHEGGLQFAVSTWDGFKPAGYPDGAHQASPDQQIAVAERVRDAQGWGAWPTCSRKLGLR